MQFYDLKAIVTPAGEISLSQHGHDEDSEIILAPEQVDAVVAWLQDAKQQAIEIARTNAEELAQFSE